MSGVAGPSLIILSAPSGSGKTTIARALARTRDDVEFSVSATTRAPRPGEQDGRDYHFTDAVEFAARRERGDFLESARYGDNWYGTLASEVERVLAAGRHVLLDIETEGARQLRERRADVVSIFVLPPSAEALIERLGGRRSDSPEQMRNRMRHAIGELAEAGEYDHIVINDRLEEVVVEVGLIIDGLETGSDKTDLDELIAALRSGLARYADESSTLR